MTRWLARDARPAAAGPWLWGVVLVAYTAFTAVAFVLSFAVGVPDMWVNLALLGGAVLAVAGLGVRTGWQWPALLWSLPTSLVLTLLSALVVSVVLPAAGPLVEVRENQVLRAVQQYADDAGFTALVVPAQEPATDAWPVRRLADPAGFALAYAGEDTGHAFTLAEQAAPRPLSAQELRAVVAPGMPLGPGGFGAERTIPADATPRQITVNGNPAIGATMVWQNENGTTQPGAVLILDRDGVLVRAWTLGDDGLAPLQQAMAQLVPLTEN